MATRHLHRLLLVVPAARCAALNTWIRANLDPTGSDWLTPNLSAAGVAPATHAWCSFAATDSEGKKLLTRLATQASITPPADWDTMTRAQKKQWLLSQRSTIRNRIGVWIVPMDNDGVWDSPQEALTAMGLQVIHPEMN